LRLIHPSAKRLKWVAKPVIKLSVLSRQMLLFVDIFYTLGPFIG
jgi:hypothetical protein